MYLRIRSIGCILRDILNQKDNNVETAILPVKRGRGRPRKEETISRERDDYLNSKKTNEKPGERIARIGEAFDVMHLLTDGLIAGTVRSLVVSGAPGMGKSYSMESKLETAQRQNKIKFEIVRGRISAINLYKLLFRYSGTNCVVVLDDSDTIFEDEDGINLLKAALDTSNVRRLSWMSEAAALKSEDIPTSFVYDGAMAFITNKDFQWIVDKDKSAMAPHMAALMDRSSYLDLKLHHPDDLIAWVTHVAAKYQILIQDGLDKAQEKIVLDWFIAHSHRLRSVSIRTIKHLGSFFLTNPIEWERIAKQTLLR